MSSFDVESMVIESPPSKTTVCLTVKGEAIAQPRHRLHRILGSGRLGRFCVYDPASSKKVSLRRCVEKSSRELGVELPVFGVGTKTKIEVTFYTRRVQKDIDNMLKFIMDVMSKDTVCKDDCLALKHRRCTGYWQIQAQGLVKMMLSPTLVLPLNSMHQV